MMLFIASISSDQFLSSAAQEFLEEESDNQQHVFINRTFLASHILVFWPAHKFSCLRNLSDFLAKINPRFWQRLMITPCFHRCIQDNRSKLGNPITVETVDSDTSIAVEHSHNLCTCIIAQVFLFFRPLPEGLVDHLTFISQLLLGHTINMGHYCQDRHLWNARLK